MAGLGRGLQSLLSENNARKQRLEQEDRQLQENVSTKSVANDFKPTSAVNDEVLGSSKGSVYEIAIDKLVASVYQPRKNFNEDSLNELALSIKEHGLLEPLLVKKSDDGKYEIICGERRYRAAKIAELKTLPCLVRDDLKDNAYAIALIENIQRDDLNPLEQAQALELMLNECNLTQEELAKTIGKSRSAVTNLLRLNTLEQDVKEMLASGLIDLGHAKVLLALDGQVQVKTAKIVVQKSLSVRQTELFIKEIKDKGQDPETKDPKPTLPERFVSYEKHLQEILPGSKVKFSYQGENKGKLQLSFKNEEELSRILELLKL